MANKAENEVLASKTITGVTLAYLAYIAVTCPCGPPQNPKGRLYMCHLTHFYVGIAIVVANLAYFNGLRFRSYRT